MDRHRLVPGRLLQSPRGAPGRGAEGDRRVGRFGLGDDLLGALRLADPGPAGEDRDPRPEGGPHRRPLLVGEARPAASRRGRGRGGAATPARAASVAATARSLSSVPLAVDPPFLLDQTPRPGQHVGVGGEAGQPRGARGPARPAAGSCCPAARPRSARRARLPGRGGSTPAARRRRGRSCRRGRSRRPGPRSAGRGPRAGSPSTSRRSGRGSAPPGGRARAAPAARGGRGSPGWRTRTRSPPRPGRR